MPDSNTKPVVKDAVYFLGHVPGLVRHGSKPSRELVKDPTLLTPVLNHLWTFDQALAYPPNQVFIGNLDPDDLVHKIPSPWYKNLLPKASRWGAFGEIMPEEEFYGMMKICDEFDVFLLEERVTREIVLRWKAHPLFQPADLKNLEKYVPMGLIERKVHEEGALPVFIEKDHLVGCIQRAHEEDPNLVPEILVENLAARASGVLALRRLTSRMKNAEEIDYLLGCGEEAVGDRYNRGGGNMAKAIGELCGCLRATGSDVKAFCCAPVHAIVLASSLITSRVFRNVVVLEIGRAHV